MQDTHQAFCANAEEEVEQEEEEEVVVVEDLRGWGFMDPCSASAVKKQEEEEKKEEEDGEPADPCSVWSKRLKRRVPSVSLFSLCVSLSPLFPSAFLSLSLLLLMLHSLSCYLSLSLSLPVSLCDSASLSVSSCPSPAVRLPYFLSSPCLLLFPFPSP